MEAVVKMQDIISLDEEEEGSLRLLVASIRAPQELAELAAEVGGRAAGCGRLIVSMCRASPLLSRHLSCCPSLWAALWHQRRCRQGSARAAHPPAPHLHAGLQHLHHLAGGGGGHVQRAADQCCGGGLPGARSGDGGLSRRSRRGRSPAAAFGGGRYHMGCPALLKGMQILTTAAIHFWTMLAENCLLPFELTLHHYIFRLAP